MHICPDCGYECDCDDTDARLDYGDGYICNCPCWMNPGTDDEDDYSASSAA